MKASDFVKGAIKVGGTIAKVGVEVGADVIGVIAEKIDDNPEDKEKIVTGGKELGQKIKQKTSEIAEDSVNVVDDIVESGKEAFDDISQSFKSKSGHYKQQGQTTSWTYEERDWEDAEYEDVYENEDED